MRPQNKVGFRGSAEKRFWCNDGTGRECLDLQPSKQQSTFFVEAASEDQADDLAIARFQAGELGDVPVCDYETIENIETREVLS